MAQTTLFRLYRRFGVLEGSKNHPTLFDFFEEVKKDEEANPQAKSALVDSLAPILWSLGPQVLAYRYTWTSADLATKHLALEFGGVGEVEKNLIVNSLVLPEFTSRVAQGISNPKMDLYVVCDEAQRICCVSASGQNSAGSQQSRKQHKPLKFRSLWNASRA